MKTLSLLIIISIGLFALSACKSPKTVHSMDPALLGWSAWEEPIRNDNDLRRALEARWPIFRLQRFCDENFSAGFPLNTVGSVIFPEEPHSARLMFAGDTSGLVGYFYGIYEKGSLKEYGLAVRRGKEAWMVEAGTPNLLTRPPCFRDYYNAKTLNEKLREAGLDPARYKPRFGQKNSRRGNDATDWRPWTEPIWGKDDLVGALENRWTEDRIRQFCANNKPIPSDQFSSFPDSKYVHELWFQDFYIDAHTSAFVVADAKDSKIVEYYITAIKHGTNGGIWLLEIGNEETLRKKPLTESQAP